MRTAVSTLAAVTKYQILSIKLVFRGRLQAVTRVNSLVLIIITTTLMTTTLYSKITLTL